MGRKLAPHDSVVCCGYSIGSRIIRMEFQPGASMLVRGANMVLMRGANMVLSYMNPLNKIFYVDPF
jgi:hypothetical protein